PTGRCRLPTTSCAALRRGGAVVFASGQGVSSSLAPGSQRHCVLYSLPPARERRRHHRFRGTFASDALDLYYFGSRTNLASADFCIAFALPCLRPVVSP